MMKMSFDMIGGLVDMLGLVMPRCDSRAALQEFNNKLQAFSLFEYADMVLGRSPATQSTLITLVEKAFELDGFHAIWATEGLGQFYAEKAWEREKGPRKLLSDQVVRCLPSCSLPALHAGMGLSIANRLIGTIDLNTPPSKIRDVLQAFIRICQDNSREGYTGAAYESLGLAVRNLYPHLVHTIDVHIAEIDLELADYFWHGVGRGIYFAPTNFLPITNSLCRAVTMAQQEPRHELGRINAMAGLAWAATLVNIRQPEIMETILKYWGPQLSNGEAFANGVGSSVIIWSHSVPVDPHLAAFRRHSPDPSNPAAVELWNKWVRGPCEMALRHYAGIVEEHNSFGELFRYQSLPDFVCLLSEGSRSGQRSSSAQRAQMPEGVEGP